MANGTSTEIAERLAELERRLDPDIDWSPSGEDSDDEESETAALDMLWSEYHDQETATRKGHRDGVEGIPVEDLSRGWLRPKTWAQLVDCLRGLADATLSVNERHNNLIETVGAQRRWLEVVAPTDPVPSSETEAWVLQTIAYFRSYEVPSDARLVERAWAYIKLMGELARTKEGAGYRQHLTTEARNAEKELAASLDDMTPSA